MAGISVISAALSALTSAQTVSYMARSSRRFGEAQNASPEQVGDSKDMLTMEALRRSGETLATMVDDEAKELLRPVILELDTIARAHYLHVHDLKDRILSVTVADGKLYPDRDTSEYTKADQDAENQAIHDFGESLKTWQYYPIIEATVDRIKLVNNTTSQ